MASYVWRCGVSRGRCCCRAGPARSPKAGIAAIPRTTSTAADGQQRHLRDDPDPAGGEAGRPTAGLRPAGVGGAGAAAASHGAASGAAARRAAARPPAAASAPAARRSSRLRPRRDPSRSAPGCRRPISPVSAITTVAPAKTTALPGRRERSRHRLGGGVSLAQVASMAGQDEEGVVDADRQPQHLGQGRGAARHGRSPTMIRTIALSVTPTPISEERIGIPAASSEPKVRARIRYDTSRPSSSGTRLGSEVSL